MSLIIHPTRSRAILVSGQLIQLWDVRTSQAVLLRTETTAYQLLHVTTDSVNFGSLYSYYLDESPKLDENSFFKSPCFLEIRSWDDLQIVDSLPLRSLLPPDNAVWLQSLALSPNGKWAVIASVSEQLCLLNRTTRELQNVIEGGEWISGCVFDKASRRLAAAHTFQGGGYISVYQ